MRAHHELLKVVVLDPLLDRAQLGVVDLLLDLVVVERVEHVLLQRVERADVVALRVERRRFQGVVRHWLLLIRPWRGWRR